jgi:hypothetical protein
MSDAKTKARQQAKRAGLECWFDATDALIRRLTEQVATLRQGFEREAEHDASEPTDADGVLRHMQRMSAEEAGAMREREAVIAYLGEIDDVRAKFWVENIRAGHHRRYIK